MRTTNRSYIQVREGLTATAHKDFVLVFSNLRKGTDHNPLYKSLVPGVFQNSDFLFFWGEGLER